MSIITWKIISHNHVCTYVHTHVHVRSHTHTHTQKQAFRRLINHWAL